MLINYLNHFRVLVDKTLTLLVDKTLTSKVNRRNCDIGIITYNAITSINFCLELKIL